MIKKWANQGLSEDIGNFFGINAELIVQSLREEIIKIMSSTEVISFFLV